MQLEILFLISFCCMVQAADESSFTFISRPDIEAPKWDIRIHSNDELQQGQYWFISPYDDIHQTKFPRWNGPLIYDTNGELIWSGAPYAEYINVMDFKMSEVNGEKMLSYIWNGAGGGHGFILNNRYELYTVVDMVGNASRHNFHELNLIDDGTHALMVTAQDFSPIHIDYPEYNGSCRIAKQGFKEVDVNTGEILFEWKTLGHIKPQESVYVGDDVEHDTWAEKCAMNWDVTHINAVDKFEDGDYLISARHTDTIYKISHKDRSIVWRFSSGPWSDFVINDERLRFGQQHHARIQSQNDTHTVISLFDNAAGGGSVENLSGFESWGLLVALRTDTTPMTAQLVTRFEKPYNEYTREYTKSRGSLSFLPNGNAFIGWVYRSQLAEYSPDGRLLMSSMLQNPDAASYRSYKMPWIGRPAQPPDVVAIARERDGILNTIVHVSWNGDTEAATYNLLHTNSFGTISVLIASEPRRGFETRFIVDTYAHYVILVALDKNGQELGRSKVTKVSMPHDLQSPTIDASEHEWLRNHSSAKWKPEPTTAGGWNWMIVGVCILVVSLLAVGLWIKLRRKRSWWASAYNYRAVEENEEIENQEMWTLDDVEEEDDKDEKVNESVEHRGFDPPEEASR